MFSLSKSIIASLVVLLCCSTLSQGNLVNPGSSAGFYINPPYDPSTRVAAVTPFTQCTKITGFQTQRNDRYGYSSHKFGNTMVVAAPFANDCTGKVFVYSLITGGVWQEDAVLTAPDGANFHLFGENVAVSDDTVVVGSSRINDGAGAIYVWKKISDVWSYLGKFTNGDRAGQRFGYNVDIDGNTIIVGTPGYDAPAIAANVGRATIYEVDGTSVNFVQDLSPPTFAAKQYLGGAVSVSGNMAAVGAKVAGPNGEGQVFIYTFSSGTWSITETLTGEAADDQFGVAVSIDSNNLIVGADNHDQRKGAAYIYSFSSSVWSLDGTLEPVGMNSGDAFGGTVDIEGTRAVVGAKFADTDAYQSGTAYIFLKQDGLWDLEKRIANFVAKPRDHIGSSVTVNSGYAIIGATGEDASGQAAGGVYVCQLDGDDTVVYRPTCEDQVIIPPLDIAFIIDASGSVSNTQYQQQRAFVASLASNFSLGTGDNDDRFAMVQYSTYIQDVIAFDSTESTNPAAWRAYLNALDRNAGYTDTPEAIYKVADEVFTPQNFRANARRITVILTDGQPNRRDGCADHGHSTTSSVTCTRQSAQYLKDETGSLFLYMRIGSGARENLFEDQEDYRVEANFEDLLAVRDDLVYTVSCEDGSSEA